jgi:signal transduction histidine kinase
MTVRLAEAPLTVGIRAPDLRACVDALLGNVFTHTPAGTPFAVTLAHHNGGARLQIMDRGPGIDDVDVARRGVSGAGSTGLGLDIARRTAHASGGSFHIDSSARGVRVMLDLAGP